MQRKFLTTFMMSIFLILVSHSSHALIIVSFDPTPADVHVSDTFFVDLIADIPDTEAINHWGLDLAFDSSVLTLNSFTKSPLWSGGLGLCSLDGDEICGNALVPSIAGISSLGTFSFTAIGLGTTSLDLSVTAGDTSEGFKLSAAGIPVGIREWDYSAGLVNVGPAVHVPEPAILTLLALGLAGLGFSGKYKR